VSRRKHLLNAGVAVLLIALLICIPVFYTSGSEEESEGSLLSDEVQSAEYNIEIYSNRHTMPEGNTSKVENRLNLEGYVKMLENDNLQIWYREAICGIRIVVKETGYIWGSLESDKQEGENRLNERWSAMANSFCTFEFFDARGALNTVSASDTKNVNTNMQWTSDGFTCDMYFTKAEISLSVKMTLNKDSIRFETLGQPVEENPDYLAKSIYFLPFLGTVPNAEIPGYMFLPDGPGALIRFRDNAQYVSTFSKKVYGKDYGIDSTSDVMSLGSQRPDDYLVAEPQVLMPVYGIAHGTEQNAFFARIEQGAEYTYILGNVAGTTTNFNWAAARFEYRQLYMQPVNRTGTGIQSPQKVANILNPSISFYFLTGKDADYVGMAQLYKDILKSENIITATGKTNAETPLRVDLLGSDVKQGFLSNTNTPFTTVEQANNILTTLQDHGINNITMILEGWQKGGVNGSSKTQTKFESKLGNMKALEALRDRVNINGQFFLGYSPILANEKQLSPYRQAATSLSRNYIGLTRDNDELAFQTYYLLRPSIVISNTNKILDKLPDMDFAMSGVGSLLYADNTRNNEVTRTETMEMFDALNVSAFKVPNAYLWDTTDVFLDIPMVNSQYLFESDTVPFLQIVLKGFIEYYNPYINIGAFSQNSLLKMLEYGTYPSFVLTGVQSSILKDTPQEDMFSTYYVDWMPTVVSMYEDINYVLSQVEGAEIVDHVVPSYGIAMTEYSNGIQIYVNYSTSDYVYPDGNITVPAQSYTVKGV